MGDSGPSRPSRHRRPAWRRCGCGCGYRVTGRGKYIGEHFHLGSVIRRRLRELQSYAFVHGIYFGLELEHLVPLMVPVLEEHDTAIVRRISRKEGYEPRNIKVEPGKPVSQSPMLLRARLASLCLRDREARRQLGIEDLVDLYTRQRGLCAVTGRPLRLSVRRDHPAGAALDLVDPAGELEAGNIRLVERVVADVLMRIGSNGLTRLAQAIIAHEDRRRRPSR